MFVQYPIDDVKMMLAVRSDLGMTKGKIGAQVGHATLGGYHTIKKWAQKSAYWRKVLQTWSYDGQKKVCVKATSEAQLLEIKAKAREMGIPTYVVADAGHTQIEAGSLTVCGLGPCTTKQVQFVTGALKLL